MHLLKLYPAYGRIPNLFEARADFLAGRDFSLSRTGGPYTSIRDFTKEPKEEVANYDAVIIVAKTVNGHNSCCIITRDEMKEALS